MDWQKLKTLLNEPLVLLEKVVQKEVEGPRCQPDGFSTKKRWFCDLNSSSNPFSFPKTLLNTYVHSTLPWEPKTSRRKDVLPEHLHAFILQLASPAEMDAEKAKVRKGLSEGGC